MQVFGPDLRTSASKAVIVAAGGAFPGNDLWDATQLNANFAYRALATQGFTKETIQYLSSDLDLDLDQNGVADDVDGNATNANLETALTSWALQPVNGLPVEDVVVYLVDHGGDGTFRMSATETLSAPDLAEWIEELDALLPGTLTVVIDACESGSFMQSLGAWGGAKSADGRIVITSTSPGESAYFVNRGSISFSNYFWTSVFNGEPIGTAFSIATQAMGQNFASQHPLIDANGNTVTGDTTDLSIANGIVIGNGVDQFNSAPVVGSVSPSQSINNTSTATLFADPVTDADGIARVWGVIRTPDFVQESSSNPIAGLPTVELSPTTGNRWEGTYSQFTTPGTYNILLYASDRIGNTSVPRLTTVTVANPLKKKAVIVCGGTAAESLAGAYGLNAAQAWQALKYQGYVDADITYMAPIVTTGVDQAASISNVNFALSSAQHPNTQDLVVYLVGPSDGSGIALNSTETLSAAALDSLLDILQPSIPGKVTVIFDADYTGGLLGALTPPSGFESRRIVLTSTRAPEVARFLQGGAISFSKYFWTRVLNGASLYNAWSYARTAIKFAGGGQTPLMDDNGDGAFSPVNDGTTARNHFIGAGILLAGDDPIIGDVVDPQTISGTSTATLWVDPVTTTGTIDRVTAIIARPDGGQASVDLLRTTGDRYEAVYNGFTQHGAYGISIFASDYNGNFSLPAETTVTRTDGPDIYEVDDTFAQATYADGIPGEEIVAPHNFHVNGDQDWVTFYAEPGQTISMAALDRGSACVPLLELYSTDGVTPLIDEDTTASISYNAWPSAGYYYLRITNQPPSAFGPDTQYRIQVWEPTAPCAFSPALKVTVKTSTGALVPGASVQIKKSTVATYGAARTTGTTGTANGVVTFTGLAEATYNVRTVKTGHTPNPSVVNKLITCTSTNTLTVTLTRTGGGAQLGMPDERTVGPQAIVQSFAFSKTGAESVNWSVAEVVDYPWLSLTNTTGTDSGSFTGAFDENPLPTPRRAWLRATATYTDGTPAPGDAEEFYLVQLGDNVPPVIVLSGGEQMEVYRNAAYVEPGFTAADNIDGDLTSQVQTIGTVNTAVPGIYTLTYTVADAAGNIGSAQREVTVLTCTAGICLVAEADGPTIVTKAAGESVTFSITAQGDGSISYQWYKEPADKAITELGGEITNALTLTSLQLDDAANYYCMLQDADEEVQGPVFALTVTPGSALPGPGAAAASLLTAMLVVLGLMFIKRTRSHS